MERLVVKNITEIQHDVSPECVLKTQQKGMSTFSNIDYKP